MAVTIICPECDATVTRPGGRQDPDARCPWCGAALFEKRDAAGGPPRAEPARPAGRRPRQDEDEARGEGASPVLIATAILVASAAVAVGAFYLVRHLAAAT